MGTPGWVPRGKSLSPQVTSYQSSVSFFPELTRCGHGEESCGCRGSGMGEEWVHLERGGARQVFVPMEQSCILLMVLVT